MNKKVLSVFLAVLMVVSSVSCLFNLTAAAVGTVLSNPNAEIVDPANWDSTRGTVTFSEASESYNGGKGVTTPGDTAWVDTYAKITLEPNSTYSLSFAYKGAAVITNLRIFAVSDSNYTSGFHICNVFKEGSPYCLNKKMEGYTFSADSWTNIEVEFKTNDNTEYYLVFDHGDYTTGFTASDFSFKKLGPAEELASPLSWTGTRGAIFTKATEGRNGTAGVTATGTMEWGNSYAIIPLEANTIYDLSFAYKGAAKMNKLYILAKSDCTYTGGQYVYTQIASGAEYIAVYEMKNTPSEDAWVDVSFNFATNDDTQYYFIFDHNAGNGGFTISDFKLLKGADAEIVDPANWDSTRGTVTFSEASESYNGGKGVTTPGDTAWVDTYAKITLEPNSTYSLSFAYMGAAVITNLRIFAVSDSNYTSGFHICNVFKEGSPYCLNKKMEGYTFSADSWTNIEVEFKTNDNTEYYLVFDHGDYTTGFTASDFSFKKLTPAEALANPSNWTGTRGAIFTKATEGRNGTAGVTATGTMEWGNSYAIIPLEANTSYDLSFAYKGAAKMNKLYILAKSDCTYTGGQYVYTQIASGAEYIAVYEMKNTPSEDAWVDVSFNFATNDDTQYYFIFDHNAGNGGFTISDFKVTSRGAFSTAYKEWISSSPSSEGRAILAPSVETYSQNATDGFNVTKLMWRGVYKKLELTAGKVYNLSFYVKEDDPVNHYLAKENGLIVAHSDDVYVHQSSYGIMLTGKNYAEGYSVSDTDANGWYKISKNFIPQKDGTYWLCLVGEAAEGQNNNTSLIHFSDFTFDEYTACNVSVESKNNATIVPQDGNAYTYACNGKDYSFKVITEPGLIPTVTVNGETVTANTDGVYSVLANNDLNIVISCGDDDIGRPQNGKDYYGNDLTKYNANTYLTNIWEGDTVYHETALFYTGRETVKLLYPVDEVISLRSYSLEVSYIKGVDYDITEDGLIKILEGSRIPVYSGALTTTTEPSVNAFPLRENATEWLTSIGDTVYPQYAIAVTYKHSKTFEDGYAPIAPDSQANKLANTIQKLENGESVNIVIYGDSISSGWSSSGLNSDTVIYTIENDGTIREGSIDVAPYAPTWMDMVIDELKVKYPKATINTINLSLPGADSVWGANNIVARLALWKDENGNQIIPDLMLTGFGVNDVACDVATATFKNNMQGIVNNAREINPEMEVLFYSPFLPNQKTDVWDETELLAYENALLELADADDNIGLVKLTSIFAEIADSKEGVDYLNTNWNHGNDFTARQYATGILAAFCKPDYTPGDINDDEQINLKDLIALAQYVANWQVEVNISAVDVNGDGVSNLDDVNYLARNLAGWKDYELK